MNQLMIKTDDEMLCNCLHHVIGVTNQSHSCSKPIMNGQQDGNLYDSFVIQHYHFWVRIICIGAESLEGFIAHFHHF